MSKYPVFERWIVRLPPEERDPFLLGFSAQLQRRIQEINSLRNIGPMLGSPPQEEVIDVADIPLPPGEPGNPIEVSEDEEPPAAIEDLLKNSAEEENVEVSTVTAPPFSWSEVETEGDSILESLDLSSAAISMEVADDALENIVDNVNDLSIDDMEDALHHAEENVVEDSMDNSTDALMEAVENVFEEVIENTLEEVIEDAIDEAEYQTAKEAVKNAAKDFNELNEENIAIGAVQEVSENEVVDEDPANKSVQEIPQNIEAVDEVPAIGEAAQEIYDDTKALEEGPEFEDPFLPEVDLEGEKFAPLASSAKKSASAEASASCAFPPYQEKPKLTIWTAIFYPVPEIFVNLRFRGDTSLHLRHTPVEDRPGEYHERRWPLSAQIPAGI